MAPKHNELDAFLRNHLSFFIEWTWNYLNPKIPFAHNWHIDLLADRLMRVAMGELLRLIITLPPRSLKSTCASVAFPAWLLGLDPSKRILAVSQGQELANQLGRDTRDVMSSDWYQRAFETRLSLHRQAENDFQTTHFGGRIAACVGGAFNGLGGDIVIIDDPLRAQDAFSPAQLDAVNRWFDNTLYPQLNNKETGAIILIMRRVHLEDLGTHVLSGGERWETVHLPAIAVGYERWTYSALKGQVVHERLPGTPLHGERESLQTLQAVRTTIGENAFSAQYQQRPVPGGVGLIDADRLTRYEADELPSGFDWIVQSWSTIGQVGGRDYNVCTTWGVTRKKMHRTMHLLHVYRERTQLSDLKSLVLRHKAKWNATHILMQDTLPLRQLLESSKALSKCIKWIALTDGKAGRLAEQIRCIKKGHMLLPTEAPWLPTYLDELLSFPTTQEIGQVDSTAQAIGWVDGLIRIIAGEMFDPHRMTLSEINSSKPGRIVLARIQNEK